MGYKYSFARKGKWICPACDHKTFVLYVDANGEPLSEIVGKCDRADNCNHHYTPSQYFKDRGVSREQQPPKPRIAPQPLKPPTYIGPETLKASLCRYGENRFLKYLRRLFGDAEVKRLVERFYIGSFNHWEGDTVFWQIDRHNKIRGGKIMLYNPDTGKRVKEPYSRINWVHKVSGMKDYNLSQCLFGEHQLNDEADRRKYVCIVESEKTAIICSSLVPDAVWLACGGCKNLTPTRCEPLRGRKTILFPDNGQFVAWAERGRGLMNICDEVRVCDIMEWEAAEQGDDICDLLTAHYLNGTLDESLFRPTATFHRLRM